MVDELALKGVDQVAIASAAGVSKSTVNQWLTGKINSVKLEYALGIEKKYGYYHRWLVMGESPKMVADLKTTAGDVKEPIREGWPFSISFEQYERLDKRKKKQLDIRVTEFIEGALPAEPHKSRVASRA